MWSDPRRWSWKRQKPVTGKESFSRDVSSSSFPPFHQQFFKPLDFPGFQLFFSKTTSESGEGKCDSQSPTQLGYGNRSSPSSSLDEVVCQRKGRMKTTTFEEEGSSCEIAGEKNLFQIRDIPRLLNFHSFCLEAFCSVVS